MRALITAATLVALTWTGQAGAQCCGDCDGNGNVVINELVQSVNNALGSCDGPQRTPTVPPAGGCRFDFRDDSDAPFCAYDGPFNSSACPSETTQIAWNGNGNVVVFILTDTIQLASIGAEVTGVNTATIFGWSDDGFETFFDLSGTATLQDSRRRLVIEPGRSPFTIDGCAFRRYVGAIEPGGRAQAASLGAKGVDLSKVAEAAARARASATPRPNFNRVR